MNNLPFITKNGRFEITQEVAETQVYTSSKVCEVYKKYTKTLENEIELNNCKIKTLEMKYKKVIGFLFVYNIIFLILTLSMFI